METLILKRDELAKFFFSQSEKIKNYNFDLCHDIAKIVNYAYNADNYRGEDGQLITNRPVRKDFFFFVGEYGSWLVDSENVDLLNSIENNRDYLDKYLMTITINCDYLFNEEFAKIVKL